MSGAQPVTGPVRADLDRQPQQVAAMFDGVAPGYDRANTVMTLGLDRRWRLATARILGASRGEKVLDLAAGTGVSTSEYAAAGAWCVAALIIAGAGWRNVEWTNLTFGVVAIHTATKA